MRFAPQGIAARIDFRLLHYKNEKADALQFGLIAEEEAKVNPNLVVRDKNGDVYRCATML
jgi:hypothetical protein